MATIRAGGVGSGLDINGLVNQLVSAERTPVANRLQVKETRNNALLSALGSVRSAVTTFKDSLDKLSTSSSLSARTASSSDTSRLTVTAGSTAVPGSAEVRVLQLAQTSKIALSPQTDPAAALGGGTFTIQTAGDADNPAKSLTITLTAGVNDTLNGLRDAINAATGTETASATLVRSNDGFNLVLTSKQSGLAGALSVTSDNPALATTTTQTAALDARIEVDGFQRSQSSNVFRDVIEGVTLTAVQADPTKALQVTVGQDKETSRKALDEFVTAFNALAGRLGELTAFNAATKKAGALQGDPTANRLVSALRQGINEVISTGDPALNTLSELGITTGSDGRLKIDSQKVDAQFSSGFDAVAKLFSGESGLAARLSERLDPFVAREGLFDARTSTLQNSNRDIARQRDALDVRVAGLEKRFLAQFTNLDKMIAQSNQTSNFLSQQLAGLM